MKNNKSSYRNNILASYKERTKELNCINQTVELINKISDIDELLQKICDLLPEGWQYPEYTYARIKFEQKTYSSKYFQKTPWCLQQVFITYDQKEGSIEIFYSKEFPGEDEGPFLKEERDLINNLAFIISGAISKINSQNFFYKHNERLKELRGINKTAEILRKSKNLEEALSKICSILPEAWQYPDFTVARIIYNDKIFQSKNFTKTRWCQKQNFDITKEKKGAIEIYYLKEFPEFDEGPFLKEERHLINNIAGLISGSATKYDFQKLFLENTERLKELGGINLTSDILASGLPLDETFQHICNVLPRAWQYPDSTVARICYGDKTYTSDHFTESPWCQKKSFLSIDNVKGTIEIYYTKKFPEIDEGPFLKEERNLINNIAMILSGYINSIKGRDVLSKLPYRPHEEYNKKVYSEVLEKKKAPLPPLQEFFDKQAIDKYIYLDMMKFKVKEILFVATVYDAFILENEDDFFEHFMGEIYQYSLYSLPRITGVSSEQEALNLLEHVSFDLVILMLGNDKDATITMSENIKKKHPAVPVYLIINKQGDTNYFVKNSSKLTSIDKTFVWHGDSKVFFAIVKSIEDNINVENDTEVGLVRVILLIEDMPSFYSRFLTYLYSIVFGQVQKNISHVINELDKISRIRSRPKILLATNYEEAIYLFNKYMDYILCVITDIEFEKEGVYNTTAGIEFTKYIKSQQNSLPVVISSDNAKKKTAKDLDVHFINKYSDNVQQDLANFITYQLGFGDFVFRNAKGRPIAAAGNVKEFMELLETIPGESMVHHAKKNQFSIWLMARGEINLAKLFYPLNVHHFGSVEGLRDYTLDILRTHLAERKKGKIIDFDESAITDGKNIVTLAPGSLGGKGRGLAFINTLLSNLDFSEYTTDINLSAPSTLIIGTDEFERFMADNNLCQHVLSMTDDEEIKQLFKNAELSNQLKERLLIVLDKIKTPVAVRSSSLFEDSVTQPFSGIFDTYILPNSHEDINIRLQQLTTAIQLVYYSLYSKNAREYFKIINHKAEEDKMAVIIQKVVGRKHDEYFYPHISGIAKSFNYYPVEHMKTEEGVALAAIGFGDYVVKGKKAYRFTPAYPEVTIASTEELIKHSQTEFTALNLNKKDIDLMHDGEYAGLEHLPLHIAEEHGILNHLVSVYDQDNDRFIPGIKKPGPRIVNFANILKYNYIPLAKTIEATLNTLEKALGTPVEIEYAVDINKNNNSKATFYLLQIKPLSGEQQGKDIDIEDCSKDELILYSERALGHGKKEDIQHIVYVKNERFDKLKTTEISEEIRRMNEKMNELNLKYVLIGPGRWGTRDRFLGIPVNWAGISNAGVIVEISLENYPLEASLGSHFFHNITSLNIGYLAIQNHQGNGFIHWEQIEQQEVFNDMEFIRCVKFPSPLDIRINGKEHKAIINSSSP